MNKIEYDPFVLRQFEPKFSGTKLDIEQKEILLREINRQYNYEINNSRKNFKNSDFDFCKYLVFQNIFPNIKRAVLPLSLDLMPYIRTGYSKRQPDELEILSQWVELPSFYEKPTAEYVVCILYSREQLLFEWLIKHGSTVENFYLGEDVDYGIVAVMGTILPEPDPMVPVTMMRNSLGAEEGGNGEKINKESYKKSVEFWSKHILIK